MSTKSSPKPRSRKRQNKEEINESVAQVHKPIKNDINQTENLANGTLNKTETENSSESNRTQIVEDKNDNNYQNLGLSRDISCESELMINSKIEKGIIGFMETEIIKEKSKYNHFTDSRPQSLSFYEEEKDPEELSGQLEQLSPEEKRVLKRRKEDRKIDIELDASTYKEIQNVLNREKEDILLAGIIKSQKSKSRKKKHDSEESLAGIGDSREQMIPSGKRKTKKSKSKSKESSPLPGSSHKKKHRKRDEFEPKSDITVALEDLQDDVFEKDPNNVTYQYDAQMKVPSKSNTVYVQKRNGFEATPRDRLFSSIDMGRDDRIDKHFSDMAPIDLAISAQKNWLPCTVLCHGLLAGLALAHTIVTHGSVMSEEFVKQYQAYSEPYTTAFFFLCIICVVSVFDRYDVKHLNFTNFSDIVHNRKSFVVIFIYIAALLVHLANAKNDELINNYNYLERDFGNSSTNRTEIEMMDIEFLHQWNTLSMWRSLLAIFGWIIVALSPNEDMLCEHLSNMERFLLNPA